MNRSRGLWLFASVSLAIAGSAHALPRHGVDVSLACPSVSESAFAAALEVELGTRKAARALAVDIRCDERTATLRTDRLHPVVTRLDREGNDVRPRLLALAVAELVRDHDALPEIEPPPAHALPAPPPAPDSSLVLSGTLSALTFRTERPLLLGGELGFARVGAWLSPGISLGLLQGERDTSLAALRTRLLFVRPRLAITRAHGPIAFRFGVSLAIGQARLSAHGLAPETHRRSVRGAWVAPDFTASFLARLQTRLWLVLQGTLGVTLRPVTGEVEGARDASASGPFASLGLGLEVRL